MARKTKLQGRKKTVLQTRKRTYGRPYLSGGIWSLVASIVLYITWFMGLIPWIAQVPFLAAISIGIGFGIGSLIVSRLYYVEA